MWLNLNRMHAEGHPPLLHRSNMSPTFMMKLAGAGGTLTHSPSSISCSNGAVETAGVGTPIWGSDSVDSGSAPKQQLQQRRNRDCQQE